MNTAAYLINKSPSIALDFRVPEEVWTRVAPDYNHLRFFGCVAYAHINQGKLEPRAQKCMFIGYAERVKGYKLWFRRENVTKVIVSRDVVFRESQMYMEEDEESTTNTIDDRTVSKQVELMVPREHTSPRRGNR